MKITDTLDQLLRLLVRPDEDGEVKEDVSTASEPTRESHAGEREPERVLPEERALPEWVRRARERNLAANGASAAAPESAPGVDVPNVDVKQPGPAAAEPALRWEPTTAAEPPSVAAAATEPVVEAAAEPEPVVEPSEPVQPVQEHQSVEEPMAAEEPMAVEVESEPEPESEHEPVVVAATVLDLDSDPELELELEPEASLVAERASFEVEVLAVDELDRTEEAGTALVPVAHDLAHLETAARVAESLNLGFHLGSAVERIATASAQGSEGVPALREAAWLIERYVEILERRPIGADLHASAARLARTGDAIAGLKALAEALDTDTAPETVEQTVEPAEPEPSAATTSTNGPDPVLSEPGPDSWAFARIQQLSPDPPD